MKVLEKHVARIERDEGGYECFGCAELFGRRAVFIVKHPKRREPWKEDDPIWVQKRLRWQATHERALAGRRQPDPDWSTLPSDLRLGECERCGATAPKVTPESLRRLIDR